MKIVWEYSIFAYCDISFDCSRFVTCSGGLMEKNNTHLKENNKNISDENADL